MKQVAWRDYRRRRAILLFLLLGFLPCVLIATVVVSLVLLVFLEIDHNALRYLTPLIVISWMFAYLVAGYRFGNFPCPRCRLRFFRIRLMYVPWAKECQHCGWEKWREFDATIDPPPEPVEERVKCLECGAAMLGDLDSCKECGWCYREEVSISDDALPSENGDAPTAH